MILVGQMETECHPPSIAQLVTKRISGIKIFIIIIDEVIVVIVDTPCLQ